MKKLLYGLFCFVFFVLAISASAQEPPQTASDSIDEQSEIIEETGTAVSEETDEQADKSEIVEESNISESEEPIENESEINDPDTEESADEQIVDQSEIETTEIEENNIESTTNESEVDESEVESTSIEETIETPKIFISEINWAGSELSQADEWIELYNAHGADVDLGGWILTGCATSGNAIALADGTMLADGDVLLISNYNLGSEKTTLIVQPDLVTASVSLSNSSLEIILAMPDGIVVDTAGSGGSAPAGSTSPKTSMQRNFSTLEWYSSESNSGLNNTDQLGTPGTLYAAIDSVETTDNNEEETDETNVSNEEEIVEDEMISEETEGIEVTTNLIINEFVSNPIEDQEEWIEIYNPTDHAIELEGWTVRDATERSTIFDQISIEAGAYSIIYSPLGQLNNGSDTIELLDTNGEIVNSITYGTDDIESPEKGYALALFDDTWIVTTELTPGSTNIISDEIIENEIVDEIEEIILDESKTLFINEFVSNPADDQEEWIEIYNPTNEIIELEGWTIRDATERSTAFDQTSIEAGGYVILSNPLGQLNNSGDSIELLNSSDEIVDSITYGTEDIESPEKGYALALFDDTWIATTELTPGSVNIINNEIIEEADTSTATETEEANTDEVIEDAIDSSTNNQEAISYEVGSLIISEIVSDPIDDEVEWIEIYNATDKTIDLNGWYVTDATDRQTELEGSIEVGEYLVIEEPKGKLNNGGDSIYLYDPTESLIDSMSYGTENIDEPSKGESLAFINSEWIVTSEITKSAINTINYEEETIIESETSTESEQSNSATPESSNDQEDEHENVSNDKQASSGNDNDVSNNNSSNETHRIVAIAETPKTASNTSSSSSRSNSSYSSVSTNKTTISGVVTALPGTFGSQIAFIEGAQLYFYYSDWPMLKLGDVVTASGELSESRGEERIKLSEMGDLQITGHIDLNPTTASIEEIRLLVDGSLVTITGEIIDMNDAKIILSDATGEIIIVANTHENMQWNALNSKLEITGILRTVSGEQRIYPRTSQDVTHIQEEIVENNDDQAPAIVAQSNDITPWIGGGLLLTALIASGYFFMRRTNLQTAPARA